MLIAFQELVEPRKQDADSVRRALTVGWCVELVRGGKGRRSRGFTGWGCSGGGRDELEMNFSVCFCALAVTGTAISAEG